MFRKAIFCAFALVVLIAVVVPMSTPADAQGGPTGRAISNLNVRSGPGEENPVITVLPRRSTVVVEGRNRYGNWLLVHTPDEQVRGWVATRYLILSSDFELTALNMMDAQPVGGPAVASNSTLPVLTAPGGTNVGAPAAPAVVSAPAAVPGSPFLVGARPEELIPRLEAAPVLPAGLSPRVWQIFQLGQSLGHHRDTFSRMGDCMTSFHAFLTPLGVGEYDLGPYAYLQETISYFSAVSPRPEVGVANSFVNDSMASNSGFSAASVLDPQWANPTHCQRGESPLQCEYRLTRPSVALIMFGAIDMQYLTAAEYGPMLRAVIQATIAQGIIPVLYTFPSSPDYLWQPSLELNAAIVQIAQEEQIPLINFWLATRNVPAYGLEDDHYHLSFDGDRFISFSGEEQQWGYTLRNLLTLQMLDTLRRDVLAN